MATDDLKASETENTTSAKTPSCKPPIEPDNIVALAWASLGAFSSDPNKQTVGKEGIQQMQSMPNEYPFDSRDRLYLIHLNNLFLNSVRSLSNRLDGMAQYFKLSSDLETARRNQAQALGSISGDITSIIPRVGASVGGLSILPIITKAANVSIPSIGGLSGYEILLLGGVLGYVVAELFLRLYSFIAVPRIIQLAQFERHSAYNRFLREAKEILTDLSLNAIRLREQFYPEACTIGASRFFYRNPSDLGAREKLMLHVSGLVDGVTPAIHEDIVLSGRIAKEKARYVKRLSLEKGDIVVGSYSTEDAKRVEVFFVSGVLTGDKDDDPKFDHPNVNDPNCKYYNLDCSAGEFRVFIPTKDQYALVFKNKSRLLLRRISYSSRVVRGDLVDLLPRQS